MFLGYVPVRLVGPNSSLETYAFIDDGSDSTLITREATELLGLDGTSMELRINCLTGSTIQRSAQVNLQVEAVHGDHCVDVEGAFVVHEISKGRIVLPSDIYWE